VYHPPPPGKGKNAKPLVGSTDAAGGVVASEDAAAPELAQAAEELAKNQPELTS